MKSKIAILVLAAVLASPAQAVPPAPATISIDEIKPGMTGYGLTVFRGFKVERFKVKVIDVLRNFLPNQDIFLVHVEHPVLKRTGVIGGMSGSPIYLDGKLAGALAYGWRFSKDPVAGITPIADMLKLTTRKLREPPAAARHKAAHRARQTVDRMAMRSLSRRDRWWRPPGLYSAPSPGAQLTPVSVPLSASGFSTRAMDLLRDGFSEYGFQPVQGGGTGTTAKPEGPTRFENGGSLGVRLVSGDISLTSTGTVTHVQGDNVLAFGHRMLNGGEIYLPTSTAKIVHCLASLSRSFKIATPGRTLGSLTQDRQAGILARTDLVAETIPMALTLKTRGGESRAYNVRLAQHRLLTPRLVRSVVASAVDEALGDATHATFTVQTRLDLQGRKPLSFTEHFYARTGVGGPLTMYAKGVKVVDALLNNPFGPLKIKRVDIKVDAHYAHQMVEIAAVRLASNVMAPGDRINVHVTFRPHGGKEYTKAYPLSIPANLSDGLLKLEVAAGAKVRREQARPEDLGQYIRALDNTYGGRDLVLSLHMPDNGVKMRGQVIGGLPDSVVDSLNLGTEVRAEAMFQPVKHLVFKDSRVISGIKTLRLRVQREEP